MNTCKTCRYISWRYENGERTCQRDGTKKRIGPTKEACPFYQMHTRAFFQRVTNAQRRIEAMAEQCEHYRELAMRATGNTQALRMSGTQRRSKVEDGVVHLVDLLEGIDAQAQQLRKWQDEAYAVIGAIDDTQAQELLELRYFNGLGWGEIAIRMHYEIAQIHRIHRRALEEAQKEIERRQAKKEIAAGY